MPLTRILDYAVRSVFKFVPPLRGKPRINTLLLTFVAEVQELEDAIWGVLEGRRLEGSPTAQEHELRIIGKLVGLPEGLAGTPAVLVSAIKAQSLINRSSGTIVDIFKVWEAFGLGTPKTLRPVEIASGRTTSVIWPEALGPTDAASVQAATSNLSKAFPAGQQVLPLYWATTTTQLPAVMWATGFPACSSSSFPVDFPGAPAWPARIR